MLKDPIWLLLVPPAWDLRTGAHGTLSSLPDAVGVTVVSMAYMTGRHVRKWFKTIFALFIARVATTA